MGAADRGGQGPVVKVKLVADWDRMWSGRSSRSKLNLRSQTAGGGPVASGGRYFAVRSRAGPNGRGPDSPARGPVGHVVYPSRGQGTDSVRSFCERTRRSEVGGLTGPVLVTADQ